MDSLEEIAGLVRNCNDCPLGMGRTHAVPGEGPPDAEIMFIGEGPGVPGRPSGQALRGASGPIPGRAVGLDRDAAGGGLHRQHDQVPPTAKQRPSTCGNVGLRQISGPANRTHRPQADRHPGTVLPGKVLSRREHQQVAGQTSRERRPPHLSRHATLRRVFAARSCAPRSFRTSRLYQTSWTKPTAPRLPTAPARWKNPGMKP